MALTMEQLNAIYEDANFSNTSPVNLENMSIYKNNITPINDDTPSGLDTIDIAQNSMIPVNRSNELDYRLNQRGSQNQNLTVEEYNKLLANQEAKPQSNNFLNNFFQGIKNFSPTGILSNIASKADKFSSLPYVDQQYVKENMVYQDPKSGLYRDPYGKNVRSLGLFSDTDGSYGQTQVNERKRYKEGLEKAANKYGVDIKFDDKGGYSLTGKEGDTEKERKERIELMLKRTKNITGAYDFYYGGAKEFETQKSKTNKIIMDKAKSERIAKQKIIDTAAAAVSKAKWQQDYSTWTSPSGRDHKSTAGIGSQESKQGAAPGQPGASKDWRAQGGRVGYGEGGIVTL